MRLIIKECLAGTSGLSFIHLESPAFTLDPKIPSLPVAFLHTHEIKQSWEEFVGANIDFRRFSLDQARSFAAFLVDTSAKMEVYTQMRPTINQCLSIAILKPFKVPELIK